jgi:phage gpG-like protein
MMGVKIIGGKEVADAIRRLGKEASREIDAETGRAGKDLKGAIRAKLTGDVLNVGTNELRNSFKVRRTGSAMHAGGTNVRYAAIHEYGGIIKPKRAKNIAIPIGSRKGSPRKYNDLSFIMPGGTKLLIDATGEAQYVLKPSVKIPKRPYMAPSLEERRPIILERARKMLQKLIERARKR